MSREGRRLHTTNTPKHYKTQVKRWAKMAKRAVRSKSPGARKMIASWQTWLNSYQQVCPDDPYGIADQHSRDLGKYARQLEQDESAGAA